MILPKVGNLFFYLRSFFSPTGKKFFFTREKTWKGKVEKSEDIQCKKKQNKMDKNISHLQISVYLCGNLIHKTLTKR